MAVGPPAGLRRRRRRATPTCWPGCASGCTSSRSSRGVPTYDVVVAGLGGFGSSAAAHLAARGLRTLGLDPRPGAHAEGSSHGETRIVRQVYFEGAAYVPLLRRAFELWADLADESGEPLLHRTGGLFLGLPHTRVFRGSLETARHWDLEHDVLDGAEVHARFPALRPPEGVVGLWEPEAGTVRPESAVAAQLRRAAAAGAELRHDEAVTGWSATGRRRARDDDPRQPRRGCAGAGAGQVGAGAARRARPAADGGAAGAALVRAAVGRRLPARPAAGLDLGPRRRHVDVRRAARRATRATSRPRCTSRRCGRPTRWTVEEMAGTLAELMPGLGDRHVREARLLVHPHAGRALRRRPAPGSAAGDARLRLLRPRLQVHAGARRGARRPGRRRLDPASTCTTFDPRRFAG